MKIIYVNDENGNNIESKCFQYDFDGKEELQFIFRCKFDKKGNEIESVHYDNLRNKDYTETYKYNEKGLMIEEVSDFLKGKVPPKKLFTYDNKMNILSIKHYSPKEILVKVESYKYKFDKTGNWIVKTHFINGKPDFIEEREISYSN